jgi:hypothetical protein
MWRRGGEQGTGKEGILTKTRRHKGEREEGKEATGNRERGGNWKQERPAPSCF